MELHRTEVIFLTIIFSQVVCKTSCDQTDFTSCISVITVDEVFGEYCRGSESIQRNLTCNNISDVLLLLSRDTAYVGCIEVVINQGSHVIEDTVIISKDLYIHANEPNSVSIDLQTPSQKPPVFTYALSFRNSHSVRISNVNFTGSDGVIGFDNVTEVILTNSSFRYFLQGAVDIYNSQQVVVSDCIFEDNGPVMVTKLYDWRGHAGGLSIAFNYLESDNTNFSSVVRNNIFRNNSVLASVGGQQSTSQLLQHFIPTGRGGGCAINVNSVVSVHVLVDGCTFESNYALTYGGGLYMGWGGVAGHVTTLNKTVFIENETPGGAGGLEIGFARGGTERSTNKVFAYDLHFIRNKATFGGGNYVFIASRSIQGGAIGNFVSFQNCIYEGNTAVEYGGAVGLIIPSANVIFDNRDNIQPMEFNNCSFIDNDGGRGGTVSTSYVPLHFHGTSTFIGNKGHSLAILGTLVRLDGQLLFLNNGATSSDNGALHAISLGQLELADESELLFLNNSGNLGAGIVVNSIYVPKLYTELIYNPLCVLLLEDRTESFSKKDPSQVSVFFSGNRARLGSAVYTNQIGLCSWTGVEGGQRPFFNRSQAFRWKSITYSNDNVNSAHSPNATDPKWYVQTHEGRLQVSSDNVTAYPGERVQVSVKVYDELNQSTISVLRFSDVKMTRVSGEVSQETRFDPSVISLTNANQDGVGLSIHISSASLINTSNQVLVESVLAKYSMSEVFNITISPCPAGYILQSDISRESYTCQCDLQNDGIVNCNGTDIQIRNGYWASASTLLTYPCPFQYCRCSIGISSTGKQYCSNIFNGSNPKSQCTCNRQGILCGSCRSGMGFSSLLNHCVSCSNISILWIFGLIIADAAVFVILMIVSIQFPAWLFPCICYLQILPYIAEDFPPTFEKVYIPLKYITGASSFYFAYDFCLSEQLSPLLSYFIRYIPLLVALLVCPFVLFSMRYCKCRQFKLCAKEWHGLWWIMNLMYIHIVYTSISIIYCPKISIAMSVFSWRWYVSGDIECYQGHHLPLALFAIFILIVCLLSIPLVAAIAIGKIRYFQIERHLIIPLSSPFKDQYKWWPAVELAKRFILVVAIVIFPANDYPTMLVLSVAMVITGLVWPYANIISNILEVVICTDVLILLFIRNTTQAKEELNNVFFKKLNTTDSCLDYQLDLSRLSYTLLPFYYSPLLITLIGICIWMACSTRKLVRKTSHHDVANEKYAFSDSDIFGRVERKPTLSEINLEEYTMDENREVLQHSQLQYSRIS